MAKIRSFNLFNSSALKNLKIYLDEENSFDFLNKFFCAVNTILPLSMKFTEDIYVAEENNKIKGAIGISLRKNNPCKCKINRLLLDENSYKVGEQLINYVAAKYGAKGVETVEVDITPNKHDIIDMFSKACGFRYCLDYKIYKIRTNFYKNHHISHENLIFRPFKQSDSKNIADLFNQNIQIYYKFPLSKIKNEFEDALLKGLDNKSVFKYILEDKFLKQIRGYIQIETTNNNDFLMELTILPSFEQYFKDMVSFGVSQISKRASKYNLYLRNNGFHTNANEIEQHLKEFDNELIDTKMIFVKDFYKPIKEEEKGLNAGMIYNEMGSRPAFKI